MSDYDDLTVVISGSLAAIAAFQPLLESLDGRLTIQRAEGADDGEFGVIRWRGRAARPRRFAVRGPRSGRGVRR